MHHLNLAPGLTQTLSSDIPSSLTPHSHDWEEDTRMTYCLRRRAQHNHPALQRNELGFNPHERASPSTEQFWDTVYATHEDRHISDDNGADEDSKAWRLPDGERGDTELVAALVCAEAVFGYEGTEDAENYGVEG
jgi:hypothetical protein